MNDVTKVKEYLRSQIVSCVNPPVVLFDIKDMSDIEATLACINQYYSIDISFEDLCKNDAPRKVRKEECLLIFTEQSIYEDIVENPERLIEISDAFKKWSLQPGNEDKEATLKYTSWNCDERDREYEIYVTYYDTETELEFKKRKLQEYYQICGRTHKLQLDQFTQDLVKIETAETVINKYKDKT